MRRRLAPIVTILAALTVAAPAHAGFFAAEPIDGPSADILSLGDLDVARDGTGAVGYIRRDGGVPHVFVSRLVNGVYETPQRVDTGLEGAGTQVAVAVGDGGRIAAVFINGGAAFATLVPKAGDPWTAPQLLSGGASDPSVDMSIHGAAYATYTATGNVLAARLDRTATSWTGVDQALDIDPARPAGIGTGRSRVAIAADATAVAVWGEAGGVFARRLYRTHVSDTPIQVSVDSLDGHPAAAGGADLPDVDIEDDSSFAYVAFRQQFANGAGGVQSRAIARRLQGSRILDPVAADPLPWGGDSIDSVDVALSGRGAGSITAGTTTGGASAAIIKDDKLAPPIAIGGSGLPAQPIGAIAETLDRVIGWTSIGDSAVHARYFEDRADRRSVPAPGPDTVVSNPDFGPVDPAGGFDAAANRVGDFSLAFVQGDGDQRRLVAAGYDRVPGLFNTFSGSKWRNPAKAPLAWGEPIELWGPLTYTVIVDGKPVAQTTDRRLAVKAGAIREGRHTWKVVATDRRGQSSATKLRTLRIDTVKPKVSFSVKRKQRVVTVTAKANDVLPPSGQASGVAYVRIDFGDRSGIVQARKASHRYAKAGRHYTIRVSATDRAGNAVAVTRRIKIG